MTTPQSTSTTRSTDARAAVRAGRRIVVKIGSRMLVNEQHQLDVEQIHQLVTQMATAQSAGRRIICVSSGAVAAGLAELDLKRRPRDLPSLQAAAAVGQARLMEIYRRFFAEHGLSTAQVLLTHDDMRSWERHLNARNTLHRLIDAGIVPVINENDTVAVDEIRVGDNDTLSALVAHLVRADGLVILTNVEGLMQRERGESAVLECVTKITPEIHAIAGGADSTLTIGGMKTKIVAAEMVTRAGEWAIIANGRAPGVLNRLLAGEALGTLFTPGRKRLRGRQRWLAFFDRPRGSLRVDAGAARAIQQQSKSLLAIGLTEVEGDFPRGSPVRILDPEGVEIARGLVNFAAEDLRKIRGCRSAEIAARLGGCEYEEIVHRDNLVVDE